MSRRPPYVTVLVELEDWDDTTDSIVWLIEQKLPKLTVARLELGENPCGWRGIENLEKQTATLTGWLDNQKIEWEITSEYYEIPVKGEEDVFTGDYEEGYKVTIEKRHYDKGFKREKLGEYIIKGANRKEFQIIEVIGMGNCTTCKFAVYKGHDKRGMYPDYYCRLCGFVQANPYAECESYQPKK